MKDWTVKEIAITVAAILGLGGGGTALVTGADSVSTDTLEAVIETQNTEDTARMDRLDVRITKNADALGEVKQDISEINVRIEKLDTIEIEQKKTSESIIRQEMMMQQVVEWLKRNQNDTTSRPTP